jgi:triacylglycerol lipase
MHAGTSAIIGAAFLLLSLALIVLARRFKKQRAEARSALPERELSAPAPLLPRANERQAVEGAPAAGPVRGADTTLGSAVGATTPAVDASLDKDAGAPPEEASPCTDAPASEPTASAVTSLSLREERPLLWIPRARRGQMRYPIVLAHGFGGFDVIHFGGRTFAYFRGVAEHLRSSGAEAYVLRVSPVASIAVRARQLAEQIQRLPAERVNIVAHSMGGLDARYAITGLGIAPRIASLTTIGTPHRGTPLADLSVSLLSHAKVLGRLGLSLDAFHDLTTSRMYAFNQEIEDAPGVEYGCFVAAARRGVTQVNALLVPAYLFLHVRAGDNDGVVPAASQRWGRVWGEIDADHWGAVGWSAAFDAATFYERLATDLRERGL